MSELTTPKMSHEEMMDTLKGLVFGTFDRTTPKEREALDMAISDLSAKEPKNGERFCCPNCGFKADWYIPDSAEKKAEIEKKCNRINSIANFLKCPLHLHREIQELLCEILDTFDEQIGEAESEGKE